jgi:predicted methyltransferase
MFNTLKPGGILGITDHRSNTTVDAKGYTCEPCMIKDAEAIGFIYVGSSQINANPKIPKIILEAFGISHQHYLTIE